MMGRKTTERVEVTTHLCIPCLSSACPSPPPPSRRNQQQGGGGVDWQAKRQQAQEAARATKDWAVT